jgi:2,3-bisphosphoglycerate-dependent phosphoglycerate mutase
VLLYVVRHAAPAPDPAAPRAEWALSPQGRAAAAALALRLPSRPAAVWSSPERRALQTAEALGAPVVPDPDLREAALEAGFLSPAAFTGRVARFLDGEPDPAFEEREGAARRVLSAFHRAVAASPGPAAALVSHGRILTLLFEALSGARLGAAGWRSIAMPDVAVVDLAAGAVTSGFFRGLPLLPPDPGTLQA